MAIKKSLAAFITVLLLVGHATGDSHCPDKFNVYDSNTRTCYAVITEPLKTFTEARNWCQGLSAPPDYSRPDLAIINSEDIQNTLKSALTESQAERLWIGLMETFTDWTWVLTHRALRPQGCFNKASLSEDSLNIDMTQRLVNVTNSKCQKICEEEGYKYAGVYMVWTEAKCNCGNKFEWRFEGNMPTECNTVCPADTSEICGNKDKVLVYRIRDTSKTYLWLSSEPNNYDGYAKCLTLTSWSSRKWDDRKCGEGHKTSHICQYPSPGESDCSGYYYSKTRICIKLFKGTDLSWFEARSRCLRDGGDLIAINSTDLHEFIIKKPEIAHEQPSTHWWIGAQSSNWTWINGQQLSTFTNWDVSNPSKPNGHCVVIHVNSGGGSDESKKYKWEDNSCESQYGFICETALPQPQTTPTTTPKTRPPTAASATTKPTSRSVEPTTTTVKPGSGTTGNQSNINGQETAESTSEVIFTNGVIVAIVIASVAVLVATVRLFVYCCHRRRSPSDDRRGLSP